MAANTEYLDSTPTVLSSLSLNGSRATLSALYVVASGTGGVSLGAVAGNARWQNSSGILVPLSVADSITSLQVSGINVGAGTALYPTVAVSSESSLGLYRSAASTLALSYGVFQGTISYSGLTQSTSATTANQTVQGSFRVSILSLTSNGAQLAIRSGNTTYLFASDAVG